MLDPVAINPDDDTLSIHRAALELGVSREAIRIAILHGRLRGMLIAGRYVIRRQDLELYRTLRENGRRAIAALTAMGLSGGML